MYRKRKDDVWEVAKKIQGLNPDTHRKDTYGNIVYYNSYGKDTKMGWNIDHINPQSKGGSDGLRNLQILQTSQNKSIGNITVSQGKKSRHK